MNSLFEELLKKSDENENLLKSTLFYAIGVNENICRPKKDSALFKEMVAIGDGEELSFKKEPYFPIGASKTSSDYAKRPFVVCNKSEKVTSVSVINFTKSNLVYGELILSDIGLSPKKSYIYYEHSTKDFGYVNGTEVMYYTLNGKDDYKYYSFVEKPENPTLYLGRIDKLNHMMSITDVDKDAAVMLEGGSFALICDEDYILLDEKGEEIITDRYGIILTGSCEKNNKTIRMLLCE